ncbi:MAG: cytochrome c1 [Saprospiraceae bacterium]|nr:cytochrome c1 [Saprospiraceae bacterium]
MMFAGDKIGDLMKTTMPPEDAKKWFGIAPPDLTLAARVRKPEWIYTYLRSFYLDDTSTSGWSNTLFPNVAMPHILYELEGSKQLVGKDPHTGKPTYKFIKAGTMTTEEYNAAMRDLTNFLVYLAEPIKLKRYSIGAYVIGFLLLLLLVSYALKKEYWRDVH